MDKIFKSISYLNLAKLFLIALGWSLVIEVSADLAFVFILDNKTYDSTTYLAIEAISQVLTGGLIGFLLYKVPEKSFAFVVLCTLILLTIERSILRIYVIKEWYLITVLSIVVEPLASLAMGWVIFSIRKIQRHN